MLKKISLSILMMMMVLLMTVSTAFAASSDEFETFQDSSGNVNIEGGAVPDTEFVFPGANITVNSIFDTTTFFMGNSIILDGEYNGDVFVAGNTVTVNGKINGNLYTGANQVVINGEVRDVFAACADLIIGKTANINRDAFLAGSNVNIDGVVGRNLRVGAGKLSINGTVNGFVESEVDQLTINDGATIAGPINNKSKNEAVVAESANVPVINWEKVTEEQSVEVDQGPSIGSIILSIITKLAFALVIWVMITFLAKGFSANTKILAKKYTLPSFGIGAAFLFLSPLLIILSFIIYVPFGFAMTFFIIALTIISAPVAVVVFSKLLSPLFDNKMKPLLSSFVSVLIIAIAAIIISYIPILNFLVFLILTVMGIGFIFYNVLFTNTKLKVKRENTSSFVPVMDEVIITPEEASSRLELENVESADITKMDE